MTTSGTEANKCPGPSQGNLLVMMNREGLKFGGTGGPVALSAYPAFKFSDPVDCENFLQVVFELYPDTMVGDLYYTLETCDDEMMPVTALSGAGGQWLPDPIDGASAVVGNDNQVTVNRFVKVWSGGNVPVNAPLPHRWVRIGVAAGTSGNLMAIVKRIRLASQ